MKAAGVTRYGPPEVLEIRDLPAPVPQDHEVLVRVHASTVCFGDRLIRQGPLLVRLMNGLRRPKTTILHGRVRSSECRPRDVARRRRRD